MLVKKTHRLTCRRCKKVVTLREYEGIGGLYGEAGTTFCDKPAKSPNGSLCLLRTERIK